MVIKALFPPLNFLYLFMLCVGLLVFSSASQASTLYQVVKVAPDDKLNMRAGAGVSHDVVARIPPNATGISLTGATQKIGSSQWVAIRWQGHGGWVNQFYLAPMQSVSSVPPSPVPSSSPAPVSVATPPTPVPTSVPTPTPTPIPNSVVRTPTSGMWVLHCGGRSPSWTTEILPEWLNGTFGTHRTGMPILHSRQEHGRYRNVALKTEVSAANRWNKMELTIRYTRSCRSILTGGLVSFEVNGSYNDQALKGCCHAVRTP